jgi:hypothetical protein
VGRKREKPALGEGAAFVKARLKRLRQEKEDGEADFRVAKQSPARRRAISLASGGAEGAAGR